MRAALRTTPWAAARRRAETLRDRYPHAAGPLALYAALVDVWEDAWAALSGDGGTAGDSGAGGATPAMSGAEVAAWAAKHALPRVVEVSRAAGPGPLAAALDGVPVEDASAGERLLSAWLRGEELDPLERYLARVALRGPLEAVDPAEACAADPAPRGDRRCPHCGGLPQLSFRDDTGDGLVNGSRRLQCARCGHAWGFSSNACAGCGESRGRKRTVYAEYREGPQVGRGERVDDATFPHLRIEACDTCRRYLLDVDLGREPRAVPEVDELAALPLDLYAAEKGLTKITPNVMGF